MRSICGEQVIVAEGKENIDFSKIISMNETSAYLWEAVEGKEFTALQGTWLHPKLAIRFAQWLDIQFAIWCDEQIERLLTEQPAWRQQRRELGSITRLKNRLLQEQRAALGKDTQPYHYSNEALMENEALTGRREPIDRDSLPMEKLAMLDTIQAENAVMIAQGIPSATRKARLFAIAAPIREAA